MIISFETIEVERTNLDSQAATHVKRINETRDALGKHFEQRVDHVTEADFREAIAAVFADGDRAVNVAALMALLRDLDVTDDHPGFIVDELLGRRLAATIAGGEPRATLAEATFHFIDIVDNEVGGPAGLDDLDAAIAAGFQTRLPGWAWQSRRGPFDPPD